MNSNRNPYTTNKTWYSVYRNLCKDVEIVYPLKQTEIQYSRYRQTGCMILYNKKYSIIDAENDCYMAYMNAYRSYGGKMDLLNDELRSKYSIFEKASADLHTVIYMLYMSGYRANKLYDRFVKYILSK